MLDFACRPLAGRPLANCTSLRHDCRDFTRTDTTASSFIIIIIIVLILGTISMTSIISFSSSFLLLASLQGM
jgi:hypothetical protein